MMKNKLFVSAVCSFLLLGCGHESSEVEDFFPSEPPKVIEPEPFTGNGVYLNELDFAIMIVDSERETHPIVVGDFASNSVLLTHIGEFEGGVANTLGVTRAVNDGDYLNDPTIEFTGEVSDNGMYIYGDINNEMVAYSFAKTGASMNLASLVGTHTNPIDGTTWRIAIDGSFQINGTCIVSGKLRYNSYYFDVLEAEASNCDDDNFNGIYEGVMATVTYNEALYLAGVIANDNGVMWSTTIRQ